jgi:hypothetical protein
MITLALMMDYLPFPGETQFLAFMRGNYLEWFPNLPAQSQFNRRLRRLDGKLEQMKRTWVVELGATSEKNFLIDTKPLPILGLKRVNQHQQHSPSLNRWISRIRQRIEGVFHKLQNTGRNPECLLNKTVEGFCVHIAAKIASHTLRTLLRSRFGIDVLTFKMSSSVF